MNTNAIYGFNRLNAAAHAGDVDLLYTIIQDDPFILERIDSIPFVETPLHTAAYMGHLQFATEIMMLKPSFAFKLNPQGFSPIHLAMQNDQKRMVYRFVDINEDLVRLAGRDCLTPLHFASQIGEVDLLAHFLKLCPKSINDRTVRSETALHIAVKNGQYEALQVLVGWLERITQRGASELQSRILNKKDEAGNTILHIAALSSEPKVAQVLQLLVGTNINLQTKNLENKTALDIASAPEVKGILFSAGSKPSLELIDAPTLAHWLRSKTTTMYKLFIGTFRARSNITEEQRNTWLIVATLIATTIYEASLSPPGGVYQISAGDNNLNITSSNSTISTPKNVGKSVLSTNFGTLSLVNTACFLMSTTTIVFTTPSWKQGYFVFILMSMFVVSYLISMILIAPTKATRYFLIFPYVLNGFGPLVLVVMITYFLSQQDRMLRN